MARTRLVSPGNQATTSTGLNYLLAEDNDNMRVPFAKGKIAKEVLDKGRRGFMKTAGAAGAGIAALKTGLLGFGKEAAPVVEKAVETVQGAPSYFFDLVSKIKMFGKQSKVGPQDRVNEFSYTGKNGDEYTLTEDIATGDAQITKDKMGAVRVSEDDVTDGIVDRSVMEYKSGKGMADESTGKKTPVDEYDEYKVEFDQDGTEAGADILDESVQKEIIEEASKTITKKADGGRIGLFLGGPLIKNQLTQGKSLLKNMLKFMSKDGSHKKSPAEILKMLNPKQFQKLLNNPKYQGQVSSEAPEGLDKIIQDMIGKTTTDRSDMVGDIISTSRKIKKTDDDIIDYKNKIIKDLMDRGSDKETAEQFAETLALQVSKAAGKKSTPEITEQGLLELENIQKNLVTKDRKLQATGGLTTMLGE
jgi:hypothetical protein